MHLTHKKNYPLQVLLIWVRLVGPNSFCSVDPLCGRVFSIRRSPRSAVALTSPPILAALVHPPLAALRCGRIARRALGLAFLLCPPRPCSCRHACAALRLLLCQGQEGVSRGCGTGVLAVSLRLGGSTQGVDP